ncbi:MAG: hypothetical protein QNJ19_04995 [Woeseiaceae bacterium]|nr:hypothetical protein [Woeseiaceae bacterium]
MPKPRLALVLLAFAPEVHADDGHYVLFRAQPAIAEIDVSDTQQKDMPTLRFPFRLDAACARPARAALVSLNVADVRKSWSADEDGISVEESLVIPAKQTAPVMADFCISGDYGVTQLVRSVFTAQIALTCKAGNSQTIRYQSTPLDVELACLQPPEELSTDEPDGSSEASASPEETTSS